MISVASGLILLGGFTVGGLLGWLFGTRGYPEYATLLRRWVRAYKNTPGSDTTNLQLYHETRRALGEEEDDE